MTSTNLKNTPITNNGVKTITMNNATNKNWASTWINTTKSKMTITLLAPVITTSAKLKKTKRRINEPLNTTRSMEQQHRGGAERRGAMEAELRRGTL
jgi:hypothetical protein